MIRGTIFGFDGKYAVVITEEGKFVSIKRVPQMKLGHDVVLKRFSTIEFKKNLLIVSGAVSSIAAMLIIAFLSFGSLNIINQNTNIKKNQNLNTKSTESVIISPTKEVFNPTPSSINTPKPSMDKLGIKMINPSNKNGMEWYNKWNQGSRQDYTWGGDKYDSECFYWGNGSYTVFGSNSERSGEIKMSGIYPEIFVRSFSFDKPVPPNAKKWNNIEMTYYTYLTSIKGYTIPYGIDAFVRTDNTKDELNCNSRSYSASMLFNGSFVFVKNTVPHNSNGRKEAGLALGKWPSNKIPLGIWIGIKFIARNANNNKKVVLELYRDLSNGKNGGTWELISSFTDYDGWSSDIDSCCDVHKGKPITEPNFSVVIGANGVDESYFKNYSVREIDPLP